MGVGGAVRRDLESEGEAVATFDLRLLPRLEVTGELGRGEGLERFFSFLEMGSKNEFK